MQGGWVADGISLPTQGHTRAASPRAAADSGYGGGGMSAAQFTVI